MKSSTLVLLSSLLALAFDPAVSAVTLTSSEVSCACDALPSPILPSDAAYHNQTIAYWDARSNQSPTCVYLPETEDDVASALETLYKCNATYAIRGGGHMNFPGSNGITQGVLVSLERMTNMTYNENDKTVNVGPGNRWVDVYSALDKYGRYTIGGRLKTIGVPGLTLIGGYHYFINKYGFTMDNVVSYRAVLGNGTKVTASRESHPELFWGLKGSGNNLALVTDFELKTYPIKKISTTIQTYPESEIESFLDATMDTFKYTHASLGAGGIYTISYNASLDMFTASLLGVQEGIQSPPSTFKDFSKLNTTLKRDAVLKPMDWHSQFDTPFQIQRIQFGSHTMIPDKEQLRHLYQQWRKAVLSIRDVQGLYATFVLNLTPKTAIAVGKKNGIGNLWEDALEEEDQVIFQTSTVWTTPADDLRMYTWTQTLNSRLNAQNERKGLARKLSYMGDIGEQQNPFQTFFSQKTLQRLRAVREDYDPEFIFTRNVWGGFKLGY